VNYESYPDLYWALRGGGNNFGIVTRFDVFTFPQGNLWGGANYYTIDKAPTLIDAFSELNINSASDPYATVILAFGYVSYAGWLALTDLEYGKPIPSPPIFEDFTSIPPFESTMAINSLSNLTLEIEGTATYAARYSQPPSLYRIDIASSSDDLT
jgi:hypothetical protein